MLGKLVLDIWLVLDMPGNNQGFGFIQIVRVRIKVEDIGVVHDS